MRTEITDPLCRAWTPPDNREIDEWAREYIKVGPWSPWEGDFSTERTPFIVAPLRRLGSPGAKRVTVCGPAAGGKSTIGEVFLAWSIDNAPGFAAWFAQDEDAAKEFAETRVQRFLGSCERVSRWFPTNRHMKRTQAIHFPHMSFVIQAANQGNAQSKHIRHLICDEPWLYKPGMLAQLHKRTTRFAHNRTILEMSTGSLEGDEFDQAWQQGSRQEWQVFCPSCRRHHVPRWTFGADAPGGVQWSKSAKRSDGTWDQRAVAESTGYQCPNCQTVFAANAANGYTLNSYGEYSAPASDAMPSHWSFHWNCIASDFAQLGQIAVEYLQAKAAVKRGTTTLLQEFTQKKLALAWADHPIEIEIGKSVSGYKLGDKWPELNQSLMAVDCQGTHFWAVVRGFDNARNSRLIDCRRLESWESVRAFQEEHGVQRNCVVVDSGHFADAVYTACCRWGWFAIKGERVPGGYLLERDGVKFRSMSRMSDQRLVPAVLHPESVRRMCRLLLVSDDLTSEVLDRARSGLLAGWTMAGDAPDYYRSQMAARVRVSRREPGTGRTTLEWKTVGKQGEHLWDCERYILAAAAEAKLLFLTEQARALQPNDSTHENAQQPK
jgi:hypothetical protein